MQQPLLTQRRENAWSASIVSIHHASMPGLHALLLCCNVFLVGNVGQRSYNHSSHLLLVILCCSVSLHSSTLAVEVPETLLGNLQGLVMVRFICIFHGINMYV